MRRHRLGWAPALCAGLVVAGVGCGTSMPEGCDVLVEPGTDDQTAIQAALVGAGNGDTVCLAAGTFTLTDSLEVSNLSDFTLRGAGRTQTVLNFDGQASGGTGVDMMNMTRVVVEDLTILDAAGNGLRITAGNQVVIRRVVAGWTSPEDATNGKYAIYPVSSRDVLIEDSEAYGSSDAGIYVGQATNCIVRNSYAHGNVAGIEIENSLNCEVYENRAIGNTGGILVFELPGLPMNGSGTLVRNNTVTDNTVDNFAGGGIISTLPRGTGIFVLAANDLEVRNNTITGNPGTGIAIVSWGTAEALGRGAGGDGYDPWTEDVNVHDNVFMNNGYDPGTGPNPLRMEGVDPLSLLRGLLMGAGYDVSAGFEDVVWDGLIDAGAVESNALCIQNNGAATFRNLDIVGLLGDGATSTTDLTPHLCAGTPRPAVVLPFEG